MKLFRVASRSVTGGFYHRQFNRSLVSSTPIGSNSGPGKVDNQNENSVESNEDFENRILGGLPDSTSSSIFGKLDGFQKPRYGQGMNTSGDGGNFGLFGGNDETFSSLIDGMEGKLKKAATFFEINPEELAAEDYTFRPDVNFKSGVTYTPEDLNLRKPGVWRPKKRAEFEVTTKEVLQNADFRALKHWADAVVFVVVYKNVRFLASFLTEAGIIIKRSKTGISAKAQRKIAREIKTARAFGLLPFTTMGTKSFVYGKTMEDQDHDFEADIYDTRADADDVQDPLAE